MSKAKKSPKGNRGITSESRYYSEFCKLSQNIRKTIYRLRLEKKLTQEKMQDYELNLRQFQRIENGETQNMTLANLFKIARALGVSVADLLG